MQDHNAEKHHTHFTQVHNGVPVIGSFMKVHTSEEDIEFVNGVFVPDITTDTRPSTPASVAHETGLIAVSSKYHKKIYATGLLEELEVQSSVLSLYHTGLARGVSGEVRLVYDMIVVSKARLNFVRERVFIDANTAEVLNMFSTINNALERSIWHYNSMHGYLGFDNREGVLSWKEGDAPPSDPFEQKILDSAEIIYKVFKNILGRDSFDNEGTIMNAVYNFSSDFICPNAAWTGEAIILCPGYAVYDILFHEWVHAYTMHMDSLLYQYESGALNEAISDIVAETVQILTGLPKTYATRTDDSCITGPDASQRWIVGDEFATIIAPYPEHEPTQWGLRDLYNPNCIEYVDGMGSPRSTYDPAFITGSLDKGGVHGNSGVINQGYSLLVDGGLLNGTAVVGIGIIKALHIFLRAKAVYNGPVTSFAQHADSIEAGCADLIGLPLIDPITGSTSAEVISSTDCDQIENIIVATGLRYKPAYPVLEQPLVEAVLPRHLPVYKPGYYEFQFPRFMLFTTVFNDSEIDTAAAKFEGSASGLGFGECHVASNSSIQCTVPLYFNESQTVNVSIKVGEFGTEGDWSDPVTLNLFENPNIESIELINEGTEVLFTGTGFQELQGCGIPGELDELGKEYDCLVCIFGTHYSGPIVAGTYINSSAVSCTIPPAETIPNRYDAELNVYLGSAGTTASQFAGSLVSPLCASGVAFSVTQRQDTEWFNNGIRHRIFDLSVENKGITSLKTIHVELIATNGTISSRWNLEPVHIEENPNVYSFSLYHRLDPGTSLIHSSGFIFQGEGTVLGSIFNASCV